jgi:hypothetical protein
VNEPKPGDRVRIIEVLEPAWQVGDVVIDGKGDLYTRQVPTPGDGERYPWCVGGWRWHEGDDDGFPDSWPEDQPQRPLMLIVRDGKRVTP